MNGRGECSYALTVSRNLRKGVPGRQGSGIAGLEQEFGGS